MREQLRQTEAAVDSLRRMLEGGPAPAVEERLLEGGPAISAAAHVTREDLVSWWWGALAGPRTIAAAAGLEQSGPVGGLYDDELFSAGRWARPGLPARPGLTGA
jgi:hypothetical protein